MNLVGRHILWAYSVDVSRRCEDHTANVSFLPHPEDVVSAVNVHSKSFLWHGLCNPRCGQCGEMYD